MKYKIGVLSLGCPRNLVDAEALAGRLHAKGYAIVEDISRAQIALVNTCAFIQDAKRESIDAILDLIELKKQGQLKKIIVCGCLAQRYKNLGRLLPEVDAFIGSQEIVPPASRFILTPQHYAYLKICEGCINRCSYCAIPRIKGSLRSLEKAQVLQQAADLNRQKISELNIIGQDITGFGLDKGTGSQLAGLLKEIVDRTLNIPWIRLLYLNPRRITDELLALIAGTNRICKYIDLPIQHINDRILKAMNRGITRRQIADLIKKIRQRIPGVCLRTSLIVGFPAETEGEFNELLEFTREVKFERLGVFAYSREEGTPAYHFSGQVPEELKISRLDRIMAAQREISARHNLELLGRAIPVLIEEKQEGGYIGRSQWDAPEVDGTVYVNTKQAYKPGKIIQVKITDTLEYDLVGEPK